MLALNLLENKLFISLFFTFVRLFIQKSIFSYFDCLNFLVPKKCSSGIIEDGTYCSTSLVPIGGKRLEFSKCMVMTASHSSHISLIENISHVAMCSLS